MEILYYELPDNIKETFQESVLWNSSWSGKKSNSEQNFRLWDTSFIYFSLNKANKNTFKKIIFVLGWCYKMSNTLLFTFLLKFALSWILTHSLGSIVPSRIAQYINWLQINLFFMLIFPLTLYYISIICQNHEKKKWFRSLS